VLNTVQWDDNRNIYWLLDPDSRKKLPVEFINNSWYYLRRDQAENYFYTTDELRIPRYRDRTSYWRLDNLEHPDNQRIGPSTPLVSQIVPIPESETGLTPGSPAFTEAHSRAVSIETEKPKTSSGSGSIDSDPDRPVRDIQE
jgi:hypothetical protein